MSASKAVCLKTGASNARYECTKQFPCAAQIPLLREHAHDFWHEVSLAPLPHYFSANSAPWCAPTPRTGGAQPPTLTAPA